MRTELGPVSLTRVDNRVGWSLVARPPHNTESIRNDIVVNFLNFFFLDDAHN